VKVREKAEKELNEHKNHLEEIVEARTSELKTANIHLKNEVIVRREAESSQKQLVEEKEAINQELKNFAYIVSHDLKAPLRGIGSLSDWLRSDYADKLDDEGKELLRLLDSRVKRMHNLIEGILQYSRAGRTMEEKIKVDLNTIVENTIDLISPPKNINVKIDNKLPTIMFEKTRIEQVFQNLISNAIKYMDKQKGNVNIGCTGNNGTWNIYISDNGPGIEEKYFEKIFQIFQTLNSRDNFESTGVGLSLVKKIVEMYGGKIWLESEIGKGTTFTFSIPKIIKNKNVGIFDE
jgi:signal transduction histidine kinase